MGERLKTLLQSLLGNNPKERAKLLMLTCMFFFIIGGYTVIRETKDSVFAALVAGTGRSWIGLAKIISMLLLIPALFIHEKLVDRLTKHSLLYCYTLFLSNVSV